MRQQVIDHIKTEELGSFAVSEELPFIGSDVPLYQKNFKKIYVDRPQITTEPVIQLLNDPAIELQTTTVRVYFTTDAKRLPANYQTIVDHIKDARNISLVGNYIRRDCSIESTYENDALVTELELIYTQIL